MGNFPSLMPLHVPFGHAGGTLTGNRRFGRDAQPSVTDSKKMETQEVTVRSLPCAQHNVAITPNRLE